MTALRIEKLDRRHHVAPFDCGDSALNQYLIRFALQNQTANAAQTPNTTVNTETIPATSPALNPTDNGSPVKNALEVPPPAILKVPATDAPSNP